MCIPISRDTMCLQSRIYIDMSLGVKVGKKRNGGDFHKVMSLRSQIALWVNFVSSVRNGPGAP